MKKMLILITAAALFITGCVGTHVVPTRTAPTKYLVDTDCK